jgi:excisionase family DNA binding protein
MLNQTGGLATPGGFPEMLSPADAAKVLGVTEADVIASLEAGDLKGKRIGSQWRLTRAQLADFLK